MHLDVCLITVKCVLVGLDWAFTHDDFFYIAHHMFMHFFIARHMFMHYGCDVFYLFFSFSFFFLDRLC